MAVHLCLSQASVLPATFPVRPSVTFVPEREIWGDAKGEGNVGTGMRNWDLRRDLVAQPDAGTLLVDRISVLPPAAAILTDDETPCNWRSDVSPFNTEMARTWRRFSIDRLVAATAKGQPLDGRKVYACAWPDAEDWHEIAPLYHRAHAIALMCFPKYVRAVPGWRLETPAEFIDRAMVKRAAIINERSGIDQTTIHAIGERLPKHPISGTRGWLAPEYVAASREVFGETMLVVTPDAKQLRDDATVAGEYVGWFASMAGVVV